MATWTVVNRERRGENTARLAQSVEHETLNLRVVGSSPTLGATTFTQLAFSVILLAMYPLTAVGKHDGDMA